MRKLILILTFLLMLSAAAAQEINPDINFNVENPEDLGITNPKLVSFLDIQFAEQGVLEVDPDGKTMDKLGLELYSYPKDDYYLSISGLTTNPKAMEEDGYYLYSWENVPRGDTNYDLSANIKLRFDIKGVTGKQPFPFSDVPEEYQIYLEPSEKINSDDPGIKRIANEIVLGEDDAYIAAYKLAKFVSDEMTYDINYLGRIEPARVVLRDKTGVCVEYSNLFIALARSVGIPARYVSGYAYGNVYGEQFNGHAWAEVWLPNIGWVPFDPTFGELGWLDMTHIKTQVSEGPEEPSLRYSWIGGDVTTSEPGIRVNLNRKEESLPHLIKNNMWVEKDVVGTGSYNIIWMSLENNQNFYLAPEAFLTASPKILGKNQKSVVLKPGNSSVVGWIVEVPSDLEEGFTYTYTVNGQSLFGEEKSVQFVVDPRSDDVLTLEQAKFALGAFEEEAEKTGLAPNLNVDLKSPAIGYVDEKFNIIVELYNSGNAPISDLEVCVENAAKNCEDIFLGINDRETLAFTQLSSEKGTERFFLTIKATGLEESQVVEVQIEERSLIDKILMFFRNLFS